MTLNLWNNNDSRSNKDLSEVEGGVCLLPILEGRLDENGQYNANKDLSAEHSLLKVKG